MRIWKSHSPTELQTIQEILLLNTPLLKVLRLVKDYKKIHTIQKYFVKSKQQHLILHAEKKLVFDGLNSRRSFILVWVGFSDLCANCDDGGKILDFSNQ